MSTWYDRKNDNLTALNAKMWEAELLPDGWTSTFIPKLKEELAEVLCGYVDDFVVFQIKEKYGEFKMYWSWAIREYDYNEIYDLNEMTEEIDVIIDKYEKISAQTCVVCGEPAATMTTGWIMPVCSTHEYL